MAIDPRKFTERFIEEARERLGILMEGIGALDGGASVEEGIDAMFRAVHTIKGSSRMLGQTGIGEAAHRLEDLLDAVRRGSLPASPETVKLLYRGADGLSALVERLAGGEEKPLADPALLEGLAGALAATRAAPQLGETAPQLGEAAPQLGEAAPQLGGATTGPARLSDSVRVKVEKLDELARLASESLAARARMESRLAELASIEKTVFSASVDAAERLRLFRERIGRFRKDLRSELHSREAVEGELHRAVLAMRMLPLSIVFEPAARMAREIALSLGKEIECVVSGSDIELDRQIIDRLGEPLLHLIRNAIDHGIEEASVRAASGKPPRGRIGISARQTEGSVLIEVGDDGAGLHLEAIRDKALRGRLIDPDKAAALSAREIADIIFRPGFSTSPIVTDLSGRGVGLDAVRTAVVEGLKGSIGVESTPGRGLRFSLRLPPSLAAMRVLFARTGSSVFGFAAQDVSGVIDIDEDGVIEVAGGRVATIRDEFVPVVSLAETLALPAEKGRGPRRAGLRLVVVNDGSERLAFTIDELEDEREVVVKPLPAHMRSLALVSGMIATGSNELVCLLNAPALVGRSRAARLGSQKDGKGEAAERQAEILIVDDSLNTREIERDVLEAHGYRITLAEDGLDGLAKALGRRFDAVLTDVEMPRMDGFVLTERLRADEAYRDTPIIILTSRSRDEDRRKGIRAGADAYIVKGDFDQGSLLETLRGLGI
ncbi:MAG TPA: response regulator [Rectinemataceae bacterium]|nr:response regulator [Rectinemataceae bacterium]